MVALVLLALIAIGLMNGTCGAPVLAALFAGTAGQHEVDMGADGEHIQVVLRHHHADSDRAVPHHHEMGSGLAMVLAQASSLPNGDHILNFDRVDRAASSSRTPAAKPALVPMAAVVPKIFSVRPTIVAHQAAEVRGGFRLVGQGVSLGRSTVRLI